MTGSQFPACPVCDGPKGLNERCRACRAWLTIAIGRVRLARKWLELKEALKEMMKWRR